MKSLELDEYFRNDVSEVIAEAVFVIVAVLVLFLAHEDDDFRRCGCWRYTILLLSIVSLMIRVPDEGEEIVLLKECDAENAAAVGNSNCCPNNKQLDATIVVARTCMLQPRAVLQRLLSPMGSCWRSIISWCGDILVVLNETS